MRVAITGATGNVGTTLLRRLAGEDVDVVGIARRRPPDTDPYAGVQWHEIDLADADAENRLVPILTGVDAVIHLAIGFQPMRERDYLRRTNVGGTEAVANAVGRAEVGRLIHMSSSGVYSPGAYGRRVDETWPRDGVPSSTYSVDKAAAEQVLDRFETRATGTTVVRLRPGLIGQYAFGSALLRYSLPDLVPSWVVDRVPVLPMDRSITIPAVSTSDVADAILAALTCPRSDAFNLSAPTPVRTADFEATLSAHAIPVPRVAMRAVAAATFTTRLQSVHPGWIDLAYETPLLDTRHAETVLKWAPTLDGPEVLAETIRGMRQGAAASSPPLRARTFLDRIGSALGRGPVSRRRKP
ncbi:NAD-dependent epimerase/dehydratase family protein [Rhodococcus sp. Eu-32]|uniref:NAD-dependent epimerase/dehydratase family protein n=1 Tax=Rhodococcus sp. Eu-32 TaxID=1017319 RepID=UPI000DF1A102|nr:NAD-dependent epimerase/dehydratase family protein [Rhodococcus sp. Eu-32]RRQ28601.1 NAD-dependent epimerase/dehydratase family protein [Rhodococcus sp. Eu-32]